MHEKNSVELPPSDEVYQPLDLCEAALQSGYQPTELPPSWGIARFFGRVATPAGMADCGFVVLGTKAARDKLADQVEEAGRYLRDPKHLRELLTGTDSREK